jgi:O-acetyl-ADP-ribose deacetylase (regulator of RNase III)
MRIGIENVRRATRASLLAADHYQMEQIGIPGIGYGENGIPYDETARAILDEIRAFRGDNPKSVVLLDTDTTMITSFRQMTEDK